MKKLALAFTAFVSLTAFAIQSTWKSDKAHSELKFQVSHLGISDVSGTINDFDVTIKAEKEDFSDAVVELTASVATIDTRVDARNNHLKSVDFFDAEKFPKITFKSTGIKKSGKSKYELTGNLTIKGVTRLVTLDFIYNGTTENPMSKAQTAGFKVLGSIKRSDFGVGNAFPAPMVSDEVIIEANGEFTK